MLVDVAQIRRRVRIRRRWQAALQGSLSVMRWAGFLYAVPGMLLVTLLVVGAALPAVLILGTLLLLQLPIYWAWRNLVPCGERLEYERTS